MTTLNSSDEEFQAWCERVAAAGCVHCGIDLTYAPDGFTLADTDDERGECWPVCADRAAFDAETAAQWADVEAGRALDNAFEGSENA